jgi:hypothetical protein
VVIYSVGNHNAVRYRHAVPRVSESGEVRWKLIGSPIKTKSFPRAHPPVDRTVNEVQRFIRIFFVK